MKNIPTAVLAAVTLGICCGGPAILAGLAVSSLSWVFLGAGIAVLLGIISVASGVLWGRKRQRSHRECGKAACDHDSTPRGG